MRRSSSSLTLLLALSLAAPAAAEETTLHLLVGRFEIAAHYRTPSGEGEGRAVPQSNLSGHFWFFSPENVEVLVKVLDGCELSQSFWFFSAGMTNVEVTLQVTDTWADETRTYTNPLGQPFAPIQDTSAFSTCGAPQRCGQGTAAEIAATPRADTDAEWIALFLGGGLTAPEPLYQRVVADLAAIHEANPATEGVWFYPPYVPSDLLFMMTEEAFARAKIGLYHDWDCLNLWYGGRNVELWEINDGGALHFPGVLDMKRVMTDYAVLPGIRVVELDTIAFPSLYFPPRLCASREGSAIHYFFDQGTSGQGFWEYVTDAPGSAPREVPANAALFQRCLEEYSAL